MDVLIAHGPLSLPARLAMGCCSRRFGKVVLAHDRIKSLDLDGESVFRVLTRQSTMGFPDGTPLRVSVTSWYKTLAKLRIPKIDLTQWDTVIQDTV